MSKLPMASHQKRLVCRVFYPSHLISPSAIRSLKPLCEFDDVLNVNRPEGAAGVSKKRTSAEEKHSTTNRQESTLPMKEQKWVRSSGFLIGWNVRNLTACVACFVPLELYSVGTH